MIRGLVSILKRAVRTLALPVAHQAARHRQLRRLARVLLGRMPALERRVRALVFRSAPQPPRCMHFPLDSDDLSPATQALYEELKRHFDRRKR
jgi:hypothetical protein